MDPVATAASTQRDTRSVPFSAKLGLIFGTSALVLMLQLLQSRILAVQFWHHLVYFVITMGFIGFAASGTYLSISKRIQTVADRQFYAICLVGLALGILVSRVILAVLPTSHFGFLDLGSILPLTAAYTALMIPYFFAGLLVGGALRREPKAGGTLYFASLAGSAAGCLGFVALIRPLGAPILLQFVFLTAAIPALLLWRPNPKRTAASVGGLAVATLILGVLPVQPDRGKQYWSFPEEPVEFTEWNSISRIDVISSARMPSKKFILIDGDAKAPMFRLPLLAQGGAPVVLDTPHRNALYTVAHPSAPDRVLVIGVGGGADVLTATLHGARSVDAVEINPTSARIVKDDYADFVGHLFSREGVTLYNEDGRSFAARSSNRYDAIMLFAVDSLAASSTGAYVLMENYLYTSEAFRRYWELLSDRGVLQIGRWHHPKAPSESLRVFTQAYEVLGAAGVKDPGRHLAVVGDPLSDGAPFADILVSKQPLTQVQADATCSPTLLQSGGEDRARCPVTSALLELRGGHVAEGTVGTDGIVVHTPGLDDLACVRQAAEPVLVQALVAEAAVETLNVGILIRLAGLDEVQPNAVGVSPRVERSADELGPIVRDQDCRRPARLDESLEDLDDPPPADGGVHFDGQAGPREIIHHGQQANPAAILQGVEQEVQRPALVDPAWDRQRCPADDAAPTAATPHREPLLAIQAVDPFEIYAIALAAEQDVEPAIPKAPAFGGQNAQPLAQRGPVGAPPLVAARGAVDTHQVARPALTQSEARLHRPHRDPLRHGRQAFFPTNSFKT